MELTKEVKKTIDSMTDEKFLSYYRFSPSGDELFFDESGQYCLERFKKLKKQSNFTELSKKVGW